MKNTKLMAQLFVLFLSAATLPLAADEAKPTTYGAGLGDAKLVPLAHLLAEPASYVGQRVRVEGRITDVCPARGCWIEIAEGDGKQTMRFKVKDGEIVFPVAVKGHPVTAEGVFKKIELNAEQALSHRRHLAEERGEKFDPAKETGPLVLYEIEGLGAIVR